jgi:hypothetical protein
LDPDNLHFSETTKVITKAPFGPAQGRRKRDKVISFFDVYFFLSCSSWESCLTLILKICVDPWLGEVLRAETAASLKFPNS